MITAIIIEDERLSAERLQHQLKKVDPTIEVLAIIDSVSNAKQWFKDESQPDVIFLDIQLNDGTGFDILDATNLTCPVIFTTAYDEYAVKAFRFNSIDYLLKPISIDELTRSVEKLRNHFNHRIEPMPTQEYSGLKRILSGEFKKRFLVKIGDQFKPVNIEAIAFFYYEESMTYLTTTSGDKWPIDSSLDQLETMISPLQFYRVNRKLIISLDSILEIHTYFNSRLLLRLNPSVGFEVIVSRDRVSDFKRWMDL